MLIDRPKSSPKKPINILSGPHTRHELINYSRLSPGPPLDGLSLDAVNVEIGIRDAWEGG